MTAILLTPAEIAQVIDALDKLLQDVRAVNASGSYGELLRKNITASCKALTMLRAKVPKEPTGWQPIESAPCTKALEEEQWILIYCVPVKNPYNKARVPSQVQACKTLSVMGGLYWKTQEYTIDECVIKPTHWMPLPTPQKDTP